MFFCSLLTFYVQSLDQFSTLKTETHYHQRIKEGFCFAIKSVATVFLHKNNSLAHLLQHLFLSLCVCLFLILLSWIPLLLYQRGLKLGLWGQEDILRAGFHEIMNWLRGTALKQVQKWQIIQKLTPLIGWKAKSWTMWEGFSWNNCWRGSWRWRGTYIRI